MPFLLSRILALAAQALILSLAAQADTIGDVAPNQEAPPSAAAPRSNLVSPMDPNQCLLSARRFGCDFHPKKKRMKMHSGWDFAARPRGTPALRAIGEGKVVKSGTLSPVCGKGVQIQLKNGLYAYYCHMSSVDKAMKVGAPVSPGQTLGRMGSSGVCAGPHLHFVMATCAEIGETCAVDPAKYLRPEDMCKEVAASRTKGNRC